MFTEIASPLSWGFLVFFLCCYVYELFVTWNQSKGVHPLFGGTSALMPRYALNWNFALRGSKILKDGYHKYKDRAFKLIRSDGPVLVLPLSIIDELTTLPPSIASPQSALEHDLIGRYTGLNLIIESRMHHSIVQRKLTPNLEKIAPSLQEEALAAFGDTFPTCHDWTEITPYKLLGQVSARLSARALVGAELCRDPTWLDVSINYTENLFRTIVVLRFFPPFLHGLVTKFLPSYWQGKRLLRSAQKLLGPHFESLIGGSNSNADRRNNDSVLTWLAATAKGPARHPAILAHIEVLLALASVHTTLLRMVNALYDFTADPSLLAELRAEVDDASEYNASPNLYSWELPKLDSALRESQRISPPTILGLKRCFKKAHTFSNGLHVDAGVYVCLPTFAIENDSADTPNPQTFDGLRSYRKRQELERVDGQDEWHPKEHVPKKEHLFTTAHDKTALNFGYGRAACPGRFFASLMLKIVFVNLLRNYEVRFLDGSTRPSNILIHEFLFPWPWDRVQVRRRRGVGYEQF